MSKFVGRLQQIGIGKEGTRGSGVAPDYWLPKTAVTFDDKVSKALVAGSYGHISEAPMTAEVTGKWAEGNIEGELNVNSFGLILLALCGAMEGSPNLLETGVWQHDYTIDNDVDHPSLSIQIHDPIGDIRFRLAMLNSLTIDVALGEFVKYVAGFISKAHKNETASSPSYPTDHRFTSRDLVFKVANNIDSFTTAEISLKSLSLEILKNVEKIDVLGTPEPEDILNKGLKITGSLELNYEDRTWRDYMLNGSVKAIEIKLTAPKLIGANKFATLDLVFPKVHFFEWEPASGLGDIVSQSINFEVMLDISQSSPRLWSTFSLINSVESY